MANKEIASKVLDYWFAIEFLEQDSYDSCTDAKRINTKLKKFKKDKEDGKRVDDNVLVLDSIVDVKDLYLKIKEQATKCGMKTWGNLTFYIGKISRQACIGKLIKMFGSIEQAERSFDNVSLLSFQCDYKGVYIRNSLSLSTIVWAISQVDGKKNVKLSSALSAEEYQKSVDALEEKFFGKFDLNSQNDEAGASDELNINEFPRFAENAVTSSAIVSIYSELAKMYEKYFSEKTIIKSIDVKYHLFTSEKAKDKTDDEYMGLSHNYYSDDIKMVKNSLEKGEHDFSSGMLSDLIKYICAPNDFLETRERHDLVKPKDTDTYYSELAEILNVENAPLGKWPSRFMPALMQQVAVNLAISNERKGIFERNGKIFSVNGPPGTGKTTLLKEIIANNIVEKAKILMKYEKPDNAFEDVDFVGKHSQYTRKWYKFRDDCIGNYGVLVTSCNNNAVENITKELPLESGIIKNLKVKAEGNSPDSTEMVQALNKIRSMFSTSETTETVQLYNKDTNKEGLYPEIYFTGYAQQLLGSANNKADAWGLVAAPLGRRSNLKYFYKQVLNPIHFDFFPNAKIAERPQKYKDARAQFQEQLKYVQEIQIELKKYGDITLESHKKELASKQTRRANEDSIIETNVRIQAITEELMNQKTQLEKEEETYHRLDSIYSESETKVTKLEQEIERLSKQEQNFLKQVVDAENSVTIFTKIFRKNKYKAALELAESYRSDAAKTKNALLEATEKLNIAKSEAASNSIATEKAKEIFGDSQEQIKKSEDEKVALQGKISKLQSEIEAAQSAANLAKEECDVCLNKYASSGEMKTGRILNREFIDEILSKDEQVGTKAQITNPWSTEVFNREREKLLYLALQMTKEFVLSSKRCRDNFSILEQYWGYQLGDDKKRIVFHEKDKAAMVASLYQTLFLLTPVISSTFASVGNFLKDFKDPGSIGTLIIDEAGQAQPQMAVGALYRARKAIIVGDPKQVEPVVTDDLTALKKAYTEPIFANYQNKSLSVQSCADFINPFGTFFENGTDYPDWVGCPLLVHRRCISPMYDISNRISYDGIMKQQTPPPSQDDVDTFIPRYSQWINIAGSEVGSKNHYVPEQGKKALEMVINAFDLVQKKGKTEPNLFIISPFTSVVNGLKKEIKNDVEKSKNLSKEQKDAWNNWVDENIGTVHKFQGREAHEVIFVLGCDASQKEKFAVTSFVNSNIVNVAVTRAQYRLFIIGNLEVWKNNQYVREAKAIMDTLPIAKIKKVESLEESEKKNEEILNQACQLPNADSFVLEKKDAENKEPTFEIYTEEFVSSIDKAGFLNSDLSLEQYQSFGFDSKDKFEALPHEIKKNLLIAMKLYYLLEPIYKQGTDMDASCCGILFCKSMELYLRQNFKEGLKSRFPEYDIKDSSHKSIKLQNANDRDFMIGTIQYILRNKANELGAYMNSKKENSLSVPWWNAFNDKLKSFTKERNKCCHPQKFSWDDMIKLLNYEFKEDQPNGSQSLRIGGVFYESENGKKLI